MRGSVDSSQFGDKDSYDIDKEEQIKQHGDHHRNIEDIVVIAIFHPAAVSKGTSLCCANREINII